MDKKMMDHVFKMLCEDIDEADYVKKMKPKMSVKMMAMKKEDEMDEDEGLEGDMRKYFEVADNDEDDLTTKEVSGAMNEDEMVDKDPYYDGDEDDDMLKRIREKMKAKRESVA